ncbi:hypothetical protein TRICI_003653 [Trichomonascus ciferrii]|uniref:Xylanolytic transcriptional activator regulatory domain-containing protein n=1 Tax=Trichomonascus ciferrii TaxID=44093 RepID=A0A642V8C0_9ASCO|nr:hypothetical protein TRICI_003653 [Trichomonascus ciferrii]
MGDEREGKRIKLTEDEEWERFQAEIAQVEKGGGDVSSDAHIIEAEPQINDENSEEPSQHGQGEEELTEDNLAEEQRIYEELETQKDLHSRVGELKSRVQQWKKEKVTPPAVNNSARQDVEEDQDDYSDYDEDEDCSKRNRSSCKYDAQSDGRRVSQAHLNKVLSKRLETLESLIDRIRLGGEECKRAIDEIQQNNSPSPPPPVLERQTDLLALDEQGQVHYYGGTSNLSSIGPPSTVKMQPSSFSSLTSDLPDIPLELVNHLLDLYFCWQHSYYKIFETDLFLRDMETGGKFYSTFLLNSVLALASMFCDASILRSDPSDPSTAGYMFYNLAKSEMDQELSNRSITCIQGLLLLATREAGNGRNSIGWVYSGMASRMALDLGLQLDCKGLSHVGYLTAEEYRARNSTFWGCYIFDQGWSLYLGRQSVMHLADVTVDKPEYLYNESAELWVPVYSFKNNHVSTTPVQFYPHNTLTAIFKLSGIMEDIISTVYIPGRQGDHETVGKCQRLIKRLAEWEDSLPDGVKSNDEETSHPSVIMLHCLCSALKIFLYRGFPEMDKNVAQAREKIMNLLRRYRKLYSLRMTTNLSVYITFTAAAAFLDKSTDEQDSENHVLECIEILKDISKSWSSATPIWQGIATKVSPGFPNVSFDFDLFEQLFT